MDKFRARFLVQTTAGQLEAEGKIELYLGLNIYFIEESTVSAKWIV